MKIKNLLSLVTFVLMINTAFSQDPDVSVYIDNAVYHSAKDYEFDIMIKADGSTSTFELRTFQAGLYFNSSWINGGTLSFSNLDSYSEMEGSKYNGVFQWNNTDKLLNCSVNFDVVGGTTCISTEVTSTPVKVTRIRVLNTNEFDCANTPNVRFNYVSNITPLRLRTTFSWRATGCTTNYEMFYPGRPYTGTAKFNSETYTVSDADGRSPVSVTANSGFCSSQLKLIVFLEGYYMGGHTMQSVMTNENVLHSRIDQTDSLTVEFHTASQVFTTQTVVNVDGSAYCVFPSSINGQLGYIAIKHRNSIQTWSSNQITMASRYIYDFTASPSSAYADNLVSVGDAYALYTGDMNQDEFIDIFDFPPYDDDNNGFIAFEYVNTDLNGDGFVDIFDFPIYDINNQNFIMAMHP